MSVNRLLRVGSVAVASLGVLALSACGSDPEPSGSSSPDSSSSSTGADCPKGTLNAEGSTAQKNAIEEAISKYNEKCADATVNYNPTGSGAGIKQFIAEPGRLRRLGLGAEARRDGRRPTKPPRAAATRRGTCRWSSARSRSPTTSTASTSSCSTPDRGEDLPRHHHDLERPGHRQAELGRDAARRRRSRCSSAPTSPAPPRTSPSTSPLPAPAPGPPTPAKKWTGTGAGKEKSAGVAEAVKSTKNSHHLRRVVATRSTTSSASRRSTTARAPRSSCPPTPPVRRWPRRSRPATGNDLALKLDYATKAAGTYPIILVTYEIACTKGLSAEKTALVKSFLTYFASKDGQASLTDLNYAPLPGRDPDQGRRRDPGHQLTAKQY